VKTISEELDEVYGLALLDNGYLAAALGDMTVKIINTEDSSIELILEGHSDVVRCVARVSSTLLASGSDDNSIKIWNTADGSEVIQIFHVVDIQYLFLHLFKYK
jgi:WD40 repeat protein